MIIVKEVGLDSAGNECDGPDSERLELMPPGLASGRKGGLRGAVDA